MDLADRLLDELRPGLAPDVLAQLGPVAEALAQAGRIACYGVGREGLMMKALAMRLYHLGLDAHVVGDMTTPPLGPGDLLMVSAGPGDFFDRRGVGRGGAGGGGAGDLRDGGTRRCRAARRRSGAAHPGADHGRRSGRGGRPRSCRWARCSKALMFLVFEVLVLTLRDRLGIATEAMRANHTKSGVTMPDWTRRFSLEGRTALITGASSGIGQAIAEVFADAGADILGQGRDASTAGRDRRAGGGPRGGTSPPSPAIWPMRGR